MGLRKRGGKWAYRMWVQGRCYTDTSDLDATERNRNAAIREMEDHRRAIREGRVFHLWTHPFNLASDREPMLETLDAILRDAVRLRDDGLLRIESMSAVAERMSGQRETTDA